jgi:tetratricopeptide (TPR) repeat protein
VRHGEDLLSIARWLVTAGQERQALGLFRRSVAAGLPDKFLFRTLWDMALLEKKLEGSRTALTKFTELAGCRNEFRARALEELAKHHERQERDFELALNCTVQAMRFSESSALSRRKERLERRLAKPHVRGGRKRLTRT